jgi:hypothetical protein
VIGHIVGCFLALRLGVDLERRFDAKGLAAPWPDLMRDLARVQAVIVDLDGTRYRLRTDCHGQAAKAFQAAGVAIRLVLDRPEIPLHTNGSENDIRCHVTKRKISGGTWSEAGREARDACLGLMKTCEKQASPSSTTSAPGSAFPMHPSSHRFSTSSAPAPQPDSPAFCPAYTAHRLTR